MRLIIEGSDKKVNRLAKEIKLKCKRNGLKMSIVKDKTQEEINPPVLATDTAKLITACKTIEDLKKYESDTRQVVKAAYNKKLKELE